ncbi:MAG: replicative DNA helicase [Flavobacteriaceae bacterium]|nr:replicative DNA helicase [Flavobacteriaceae bacterium]
MDDKTRYTGGKRKVNIPQIIGPDPSGRMPPNTRELEEAVLGAMMLERDKIHSVIDVLTEKHFYAPENSIVFKAIKKLYTDSGAIDLLTVANELRNSAELDIIGGPYYLAQLTNRVSSAANLDFHSRILSQKFVQRELIRVSGEISFEAYDDTLDSFEMLDACERKLYEIKNVGLKQTFRGISDLITQAMKDLEARQNTDTDGITGVASGFSDLDRITSGWQPSDLIILAARPGMGKTAFASSLMRNAAVDFGKKVMIFSLEMADVQLVNRLISGESEIESEKIKKSNLTEQEWARLHEKTVRLSAANILIDDTPQLSIFDLNAKCRRIHSQTGLDLVVVDYLQLIRHETKGQTNREQEIAFISRALKGLAKELRIPIIALAQLSREVEKRGNKRPQLSDLRESGSIEQDADMVLFLYREEYYQKMGMQEQGQQSTVYSNDNNIVGLTEIIIGKNRHGEQGSAFVKFAGKFTKFVDLEPQDRLLLSNKRNGDYNTLGQQSVTVQSKMNNNNMDDNLGMTPNISEDF